MKHQKKKVWTFIFSLIPGAGEMYLGFMKQGISIMGLFCGIIAFCRFFNLYVVAFSLPVVWFYSFFHVHNLNGLPEETFNQVEDRYLIRFPEQFPSMSPDKQKIIAWACIILGAYSLLDFFLDFLVDLLPWTFSRFFYYLSTYLPRVILSVLIILLGLRLIQKKVTKPHPENPDHQPEDDLSFILLQKSDSENTDTASQDTTCPVDIPYPQDIDSPLDPFIQDDAPENSQPQDTAPPLDPFIQDDAPENSQPQDSDDEKTDIP